MSRNNRKNILINAVAAKMGGAKRHLEHFVDALKSCNDSNVYFVYVNSSVCLKSEKNVYIIPIEYVKKSLFHRFFWDQIHINRVVKQKKIDCIVSLLNFGPIRPAVKQIVFQRNPTYFCPYLLKKVGRMKRLIIYFRRWMAYQTMISSEKVVTPSYAMREMIRDFYPKIPEDKFVVIPHGFSKEKFMKPLSALPEDVECLIRKSPSDYKKLLFVSHPAPHKGFEILFRAIKILADYNSKVRLFLTIQEEDWPEEVQKYNRLINELDIHDYVVYLGRVPHESVALLYKACDLFVFPSLCESHGFPMLEAIANKMHIIAADTPINRERCCQYAEYYSPLDSFELANKIKYVIDQKKENENVGYDQETLKKMFLEPQEYVSCVLNVIGEKC